MVVCLGVVVGVDGLPNKNSSKFLPFENFSLLLGEVPREFCVEFPWIRRPDDGKISTVDNGPRCLPLTTTHTPTRTLR